MQQEQQSQLEKEIQTDYPLIKMMDITDEARMLAVAWCEGYKPMGSINLESKHKLASDIMNYARRNPPNIDAAVLRSALEKLTQFNEGMVISLEAEYGLESEAIEIFRP